MSNSKLSKILLLLSVSLLLICSLTIGALATSDGETTPADNQMVYETEYGTFTVSETYANVNEYPWVSFDIDTGACLLGSDVFAQNSGSILSHGSYKSANVLVILRKDFVDSSTSQWHNCVFHAGRKVVIDLQGHTLTHAQNMGSGLFTGEAKTTGLLRFTFQNGNILYKTRRTLFLSVPRTTNSGLKFEFTYKDINFRVDDSVIPTKSSESFVLFANANNGEGNEIDVKFNFINSELDCSNLNSYVTLFQMGSNRDNINSHLTFEGGNIKGDITRLVNYLGTKYNPVVFTKNSDGQYTTLSVPTESAVPTRIFSSEEGLLSFSAENKVVADDGYTTYSPVKITSENALPYGFLPEEKGLVTVFNVNTQQVIYNGNIFASSDNNSALGCMNFTSGSFVVYFNDDVPASATTGTVWNISGTSNGITLQLNGHTLKLKDRSLFRAQVKASNAIQSISVNNGVIHTNGQSLVSTGATTGSDGGKRQNATVYFTFNEVDIQIPHGYLVTDGVEADHPNTFNVSFNDCNISVAKGYSHRLVSLGAFQTASTRVFFNGGTISFADAKVADIHNTDGKSNVSVTFATGKNQLYPVVKTAETTTTEEVIVPTASGTGVYIASESENGVTVWKIYEKTTYGYIDEAHIDKTLYPMAVFVKDKPFATWYPTKYGDEKAGTVLYEIYRAYSTYNKVDCTLYIRSDVTFSGSLWHCSPQNNFTIDLNGNTVKLGVIMFRFQTRTSGKANIVVKNGTINANGYSVITHGFEVSKTTSVTFENVTFDNLNRMMGEEAGSQNRTADLTFHLKFNNCTFNVISGASNLVFNFTAKDWWPTVDIEINGGTFNFPNKKYDLFATTNADKIKLGFGAYNGEYTVFNIAKTFDLTTKAEKTLDGKPLDFKKLSDDGTTATFTLVPFSITSAYLNLTNELNFVYRVFLPAGYTNPVATFTVGDDPAVTVNEYTVDENGLYCFRFTGIAPHKMGDFVIASVSATYGENLTDTVTNDKVSIKGYADALRTEYAEDTAMLALLDNLLVYGAAAQVYMNYNLDNLVCEIGALENIPASPIILAGEANANVSIAACGLLLDGAFDLRVGIQATTLEGLTLQIQKGDTITEVTLTEEMRNGGYIVVYYDGLLINELDTEVTFTLKQNGETVGKTLTFSANAYLYRMQNDQNTALSTLTKALYAYGASAKAYKA